MDIAPTTTTTNNTKSPEHDDTETPFRMHHHPTTTKALPFSNGVLKRHHHHHPAVVSYKECLKNHAASLGGHALDGCGEFMPSPNAIATDPTSFKCAACGCHRNFHRREPQGPPPPLIIEYHPHHRHHPPPPPLPFSNRSPDSDSPPPISSAYYPSGPHVHLPLSAAAPATHSGMARKRSRTKFSTEQKEKMQRFAESVGWKMQKRDEDLVREFCSEVGVDRTVFKVWMHNNKNTLAKRDGAINGDNCGRNILEELPTTTTTNNNNNNTEINGDGAEFEDPNHHYRNDSGANVGCGVNGSSSSS